MKKKRFCMRVAFLLSMLLISGCSGCAACSSPPELEEVYDRIVYLIEESKGINTVIYGDGLPVYEVGSEYANYNMLYGSSNTDMISYEMVSEYAKYQTDDEIRLAAEKIYTKDCLKSIYTYLFDGISISDSMNGIATEKAKYDTGSETFGQSRDDESLLTGMRIYDYSTMKIIRPSNGEVFRITIDSWMENTPAAVQTRELVFALGEDGLWYLDTFTG